MAPMALLFAARLGRSELPSFRSGAGASRTAMSTVSNGCARSLQPSVPTSMLYSCCASVALVDRRRMCPVHSAINRGSNGDFTADHVARPRRNPETVPGR
eukprot:1038287-Prymnesium_polylepis.1